MIKKQAKFFGRIIDENNRVEEIEGLGVYITSDIEGNFKWQLTVENGVVPVDQIFIETQNKQVYVISLKRKGE